MKQLSPALHARGLGLLLLAGLAGHSVAQTPPDAGALQQQIESERQRNQQEAQPLPELPAQAAPAPAGGMTVTVSRFEFAGNTRLSTERLQAVVARFVGRPLTFEELQGATAAVADAYRKAGWIVRVFLPQQELVDGGTVRIEIVEARMGDVSLQPVDPAKPMRVTEARLRATVEAAQPKGQPVSSKAIDRALLVLDDLSGVSVGGSLAAGKVEGETDLVLRVANEPFFGGDLRIDNTGSRSTGTERLTSSLYLNSPSGDGDQANANLLFTEGSRYGRLAYKRPVGHDGWMAGINASLMNYELVGATFAALKASGSSTTAGLDLSYPILRGRKANLNVLLAPETKSYDNESGGFTTTNYTVDTLAITLSGNRSDALWGGGGFSGNVTLVNGNVDLSGSPNRLADSLTTRTAGKFARLRYLVSRQQTLTAKTWLRASFSGQFADKNLDSAEKFYIGGSGGVRAYPSSDGGGSEGNMLNVEWSARLPHALQLACFYDWGRVTVNHDNTFPGAPSPNAYALQGAGLSLAWSHPKGATAKVTWSHRIGDNPNATAAGKDQDGTLVENRIWAEAGLAF